MHTASLCRPGTWDIETGFLTHKPTEYLPKMRWLGMGVGDDNGRTEEAGETQALTAVRPLLDSLTALHSLHPQEKDGTIPYYASARTRERISLLSCLGR